MKLTKYYFLLVNAHQTIKILFLGMGLPETVLRLGQKRLREDGLSPDEGANQEEFSQRHEARTTGRPGQRCSKNHRG
jgi:hypothetical protein